MKRVLGWVSQKVERVRCAWRAHAFVRSHAALARERERGRRTRIERKRAMRRGCAMCGQTRGRA